MVEDRFLEWMKKSEGLIKFEMLLLGNAQGLGLLDEELIREFPVLRPYSELEEDRLRKLRYLTISDLWLIGSYELVRVIKEVASRNSEISESTKKKTKEALTLFTKVRVPLAKFKKSGQSGLFSGVIGKYEFDGEKGLGWKVVSHDKRKLETEVFYRKDLADELLQLLESITDDLMEREGKI